jgi:hypothetical protein
MYSVLLVHPYSWAARTCRKKSRPKGLCCHVCPSNHCARSEGPCPSMPQVSITHILHSVRSIHSHPLHQACALQPLLHLHKQNGQAGLGDVSIMRTQAGCARLQHEQRTRLLVEARFAVNAGANLVVLQEQDSLVWMEPGKPGRSHACSSSGMRAYHRPCSPSACHGPRPLLSSRFLKRSRLSFKLPGAKLVLGSRLQVIKLSHARSTQKR